jgi:hypothetical protein
MFPEYQDGLRRLLRSLRIEAVTVEIAEYSSHRALHREALRPASTVVEKDEDGFLTSTSVAELVLGRVQGRQRLRQPPILLFENSYQRTWLVITERAIACVLDDIEKPASYDPLRWYSRHRFALPVETEAYKTTAGLIHLGPEHRDWLYSPRLHPDAKRLRAEIEGLLRP